VGGGGNCVNTEVLHVEAYEPKITNGEKREKQNNSIEFTKQNQRRAMEASWGEKKSRGSSMGFETQRVRRYIKKKFGTEDWGGILEKKFLWDMRNEAKRRIVATVNPERLGGRKRKKEVTTKGGKKNTQTRRRSKNSGMREGGRGEKTARLKEGRKLIRKENTKKKTLKTVERAS